MRQISVVHKLFINQCKYLQHSQKNVNILVTRDDT